MLNIKFMSHYKFTLIVFSVLTFQFGHENYCWSLNLKQIYWGLFSYHICLPLILSRLYSVHKIQHGWVLHLRRPNLINWKWELLDRFLPGAKHKHPNKCFVAFQDEKNLNHCWNHQCVCPEDWVFPLLLLPGLKKFHYSILAIFFGVHIKAFDIRNTPRSGISKFPSKIIKKSFKL